ncbi:MAG: pyridoxal-phosphate dependent enzyme [Methanobrevibacter sp.]|jgi:cysteine synthase A|nr:pyridoxal-phosphate dependent enzyme [Candidatus Methanoflexus mossambicus]
MEQKSNLLTIVGNTPIVKIYDEINFWAKLEGKNPFGSMKDRAALYYINEAIANGTIQEDSEIIESSSGNFAVALAGVCRLKGIKFTCVIDPLISPINKFIVKSYGANIIETNVTDNSGSFVPERIRIVKEKIEENSKIIWVNQYDNSIIRRAYYSIGEELFSEIDNIDFVFVPVSTCGTIAGISNKLKELSPKTKIIAVDLEGSQIFGKTNTKQHIPGIGLPYKPGNLSKALIDDFIIVSEFNCITECRKLLSQSILVGTSSGAVSAAIKLKKKELVNKNIIGIFPDCGERYMDTIFNDVWCNSHFPDLPYKV